MILGFAGAAILVSFISSKANPRSGLSVVLFFPVAGLICMAGWALNWWLSMAGIFAARDGEDALAALSAAALFRESATASVWRCKAFGLVWRIWLLSALPRPRFSLPLASFASRHHES